MGLASDAVGNTIEGDVATEKAVEEDDACYRENNRTVHVSCQPYKSGDRGGCAYSVRKAKKQTTTAFLRGASWRRATILMGRKIMRRSVRISIKLAVIQNGSCVDGEQITHIRRGAWKPTIGMHWPLNTAHGRGSLHSNNTPVVNANVHEAMRPYKSTTEVLCTEVHASRSRNVVMESLESPIVTTYRIVAVYISFCIFSRAPGVRRNTFFPRPDSTANDPAIVSPTASACLIVSPRRLALILGN